MLHEQDITVAPENEKTLIRQMTDQGSVSHLKK